MAALSRPALHFLHCAVFERTGYCVTLISPGGQCTGELFSQAVRVTGQLCTVWRCQAPCDFGTSLCLQQACTLSWKNEADTTKTEDSKTSARQSVSILRPQGRFGSLAVIVAVLLRVREVIFLLLELL